MAEALKFIDTGFARGGIMSWDLHVRCSGEVEFEAFCAEVIRVAKELTGVDVPPVIVENSSGYETHWRPKLVGEGPLIAFRGVPSSVELIEFAARELDGTEYPRVSVELPFASPAGGYALAVTGAIALGRMNQALILDDPGFFTPRGGWLSAEELLDSVRAGKSGSGRNKLCEAIALLGEAAARE